MLLLTGKRPFGAYHQQTGSYPPPPHPPLPRNLGKTNRGQRRGAGGGYPCLKVRYHADIVDGDDTVCIFETDLKFMFVVRGCWSRHVGVRDREYSNRIRSEIREIKTDKLVSSCCANSQYSQLLTVRRAGFFTFPVSTTTVMTQTCTKQKPEILQE